MLVKKIFYAFHRISQLGFIGLYATIRRRGRIRLWQFRMQRRAEHKTAHHSWATIVQGNKILFEDFFTALQSDKTISTILNNKLFQQCIPSIYHHHNSLEKEALDAHTHIFDILGSGPIQLPPTIEWHSDFKKNKLTPPFNKVDESFSYAAYAGVFHTSIPVPQKENDRSTYHEDVKMLWDLGRMHHLTILGLGYKATLNREYPATFIRDVSSYQEQVHYLLGPQWKCPMDVAIRAINFVWALDFFKHATIPLPFWEKYICMLYDHMIYLEWNFEESDKPNNHLLADYVGYLYLAAFFRFSPGGEKRFSWIKKTIKQAFLHQILPDGAAYEGSTAYHRLDCELLLHTNLLLQAVDASDETLTQLLQRMLAFFAATTNPQGTLITIGDDDSGKIVFGLQPPPLTALPVSIYPDFGIGIRRTPALHLTLRAPVFTSKQPSGHFHQDGLGLTASIKGQPIFVDPGSFIYTANSWWRHFFKSAANHTTFFFIEKREEEDDLFQTKLSYTNGSIIGTESELVAYAYHTTGAALKRQVQSNSSNILITDTVSLPNNPLEKIEALRWRFILHPTVQIQNKGGLLLLIANGKPIAHLESSLGLEIKKNTAYAAGYGKWQETIALEATVPVEETAAKTILHILD